MKYICKNCQSDNVQILTWVNPNNNEIDNNDEIRNENFEYCCDCEIFDSLIQTNEKSDGKVIGFQVIGMEGTETEGMVHPQMIASFCVYSLTQANQMLKDEKKFKLGNWKLLTIWEGDIEEPTLMFKGDPRISSKTLKIKK